jgi:acetylornithine aminotransferase
MQERKPATTNQPQPRPAEPLHGEALRDDPRVRRAKQLLSEAVAEHGRTLAAAQPADASRQPHLEKLLRELGEARGGMPVFAYLASGVGQGPWVELIDGSVKLDFIGGIGVHGAGHSHPRMVDAAIDAALEDTVMQGNLQQHPPSLRFCQRLLALARAGGADLAHCLLTTSGAMANENALKIALHHRYPADRILAFDNAFAGRSLAMAALTDRAKYREGLPLALQVDYLPYRDPAHPHRSTRWAVDELRRLLQRYPGRHAAFWAEPVAGEGGYYPGSHDFFAALCPLLREAGIPIIFDEVQSFGRLSRPFAFQHFELDRWADIVTVGKITQVCATLYRGDLKPQAPILSQTFTGASSSIACGMAMLEVMEEHGCFGTGGNNMRLHELFVAHLQALAVEFPGMIHGPFGCGMMIAWTPGDGRVETAKRMVELMFEEGLLGFICGGAPARVRVLPPPAVTEPHHLDAARDILRRVLVRMRDEDN